MYSIFNHHLVSVIFLHRYQRKAFSLKGDAKKLQSQDKKRDYCHDRQIHLSLNKSLCYIGCPCQFSTVDLGHSNNNRKPGHSRLDRINFIFGTRTSIGLVVQGSLRPLSFSANKSFKSLIDSKVAPPACIVANAFAESFSFRLTPLHASVIT